MGQTKLQTSSVQKDLGVFVYDRLNFKKHVSHAVNKASRILGMIQATFTCLDEDIVPLLYKVLVRPHLEYGNIIWYPRYRVDNLEVEKVQRHATKLVAHIIHLCVCQTFPGCFPMFVSHINGQNIHVLLYKVEQVSE